MSGREVWFENTVIQRDIDSPEAIKTFGNRFCRVIHRYAYSVQRICFIQMKYKAGTPEKKDTTYFASLKRQAKKNIQHLQRTLRKTSKYLSLMK